MIFFRINIVCFIFFLAFDHSLLFANGKVCSIELARVLVKIQSLHIENERDFLPVRNLGIRRLRERALGLALAQFEMTDEFPATKLFFDQGKRILLSSLSVEFREIGPNTFSAIARNFENPEIGGLPRGADSGVHHPPNISSRLVFSENLTPNLFLLFALRHESVHLRQNFFHFAASSQYAETKTKYGETRYVFRSEKEACEGEYEFLKDIWFRVRSDIIAAARMEFEINRSHPAFFGMDQFFDRLDEVSKMGIREYRHKRLLELRSKTENPAWTRALMYGGAFATGAATAYGIYYFLGE